MRETPNPSPVLVVLSEGSSDEPKSKDLWKKLYLVKKLLHCVQDDEDIQGLVDVAPATSGEVEVE
jgi:hypothetical protein